MMDALRAAFDLTTGEPPASDRQAVWNRLGPRLGDAEQERSLAQAHAHNGAIPTLPAARASPIRLRVVRGGLGSRPRSSVAARTIAIGGRVAAAVAIIAI